MVAEVEEKKSSTVDEFSKISELTAHRHELIGAGAQADQCTKTTKAIGEYVGRVYGNAMKKLVMHWVEKKPKEPDYPDSAKPSEKDKAVWNKKHDLYLKQQERHDDHRAKVFVTIIGRCSKAVRNRVESADAYSTVDDNNDVVELLKLIKSVAFDSNEKKHPSV